jgi:LysR family glycine cleavage system transcriptional activator
MTLKLPPLNALKAFEIAARTGSYVAAANEMRVSPAAVSQQVRKLEQYFDKKLFVRYNNRIVLTDAGTAIYTNAAPALQDLSGLTQQILEGQVRSRLVVSVMPSLAQNWLAPRLASFCRQVPGIGVETRIEDDPVDFARDNIDLRICYGPFLYPDFKSKNLFHDAVSPICSPGFAAEHNLNEASLPQLPDELFLHTTWGLAFASPPTWKDWFSKAGIRRVPNISLGHQVGMPSIALEYARLNMGVVLGQIELAARDIQQKRLVLLSEQHLKLSYSYCAVYPHSRVRHGGLQQLLAVLADGGYRVKGAVKGG